MFAFSCHFYQDIYRRIVDLHEREYLKSQHVVTETQCDLGLTALKLDEVLQLMSTDYPDKCHVSELTFAVH
jgi:BRG1-associated factor 45A